MRPVDAMAYPDEILDLAISTEHESRQKAQNNLFYVLDRLTWHYAMNRAIDHPALPKYMEEGFIIGVLTSDAQFRFGFDEGEAVPAEFKRFSDKAYYRDIQNEALAAFDPQDPERIDMIVAEIMENTAEPTQELREQLQWGLVLERQTDELCEARLTAAVVAYSLLTHERIRHKNEFLNRLKKKPTEAKSVEQSATETNVKARPTEVRATKKPIRFIPFRLAMLAQIPMNIRREIEANEREREFWARAKRSDHPQKH